MEQLACGENRTQCWAQRSPLCQSCVRWSLQADIHFGVLSCCQGKQPACRQVAGAVRRPEQRSSAFPWKLLVTTMMSCIPKSGERRALFSRSLPLLKHPGTAQEPYRPNSCPALLVSPSLSPSPRGSCPFSPPAPLFATGAASEPAVAGALLAHLHGNSPPPPLGETLSSSLP